MNRAGKSMCSDVAAYRRVALPAYAVSEQLLVPERVWLGDQLIAVENRKNANLVVNGFVDDAVGLDDQLAQTIDERRDFVAPRAFRSSSMSCMFRMTSSWGMNSPFSNCCREIETERESSIRSIRSSKSPALMMYEAARPFCVTRTGRCVLLTLAMMAEKLLRHSENGMVSSEGRQCLMGSSAVIGMGEVPFNGRYCTKSCADRQCGFRGDFKEVA